MATGVPLPPRQEAGPVLQEAVSSVDSHLVVSSSCHYNGFLELNGTGRTENITKCSASKANILKLLCIIFQGEMCRGLARGGGEQLRGVAGLSPAPPAQENNSFGWGPAAVVVPPLHQLVAAGDKKEER